MPMIDLTLPQDALADDVRARLVDDLLATLLHWEGAPDNERSRSLAWAFVHEVKSVTVASSPTSGHHYRVGVRTPQGALDDRRRAGLIADVTELVLKAEGSPCTPENAFRVWVILDEVAEGSWGAAGTVWRFQDIASFVLDDQDLGAAIAAARLTTTP
jgi:phenylpyruvate tautomerase PptA (4-oxalocrotonate tautomerase family)